MWHRFCIDIVIDVLLSNKDPTIWCLLTIALAPHTLNFERLHNLTKSWCVSIGNVVSVRRTIKTVALATVMTTGCSTALDKRPIVTGSEYSIPFEGVLVDVLKARTEGFAPSIYAETAGAAAEYRYRAADPFLSSFFAALARAFEGDAEGYLANTRCIYIVRPNDADFAESVRNNALFSAEDEFLDDELFDLSREQQQALQRQKALQAGLQNSQSDSLKELVSLAQACNPDLKIGSPVLMTFSEGGGTISPASGIKYTSSKRVNELSGLSAAPAKSDPPLMPENSSFEGMSVPIAPLPKQNSQAREASRETSKPWQLRLGTFQQATQANALVANLINDGYTMDRIQVTTNEKNQFIVEIGPLHSKDEALQEKDKLDAQFFIDSRIRRPE